MHLPAALTSLRFWSRTWFALALVPIAWGIYQYAAFGVWARERSAQGGFVCGTGIVMVVFGCIALAAFCGALGCALGLAHSLRLPAPRPRKQLWALSCGAVICAVPVLVIALFA